MSTIKLDHIKLLVSPSNYETWKHGSSQVLQGEGFWGHVEGDANPFASFPIDPQPVTPTAETSADNLTAFCTWWTTDSKARTIIEHHITSVTLSLLPHGVSVTAHSMWEQLKILYGRHDVMSQFELHDRLANAKIKDHCDLEHYLGEFKTGHLHFIEMGITYSEYDMVHSIIHGLPIYGSWPHFQMLVMQNTQDHIDSQANATVPAAPDTLLNQIIN